MCSELSTELVMEQVLYNRSNHIIGTLQKCPLAGTKTWVLWGQDHVIYLWYIIEINICQSEWFEKGLLFWAIFAFLYLYHNKLPDHIQQCLGWRTFRGLILPRKCFSPGKKTEWNLQRSSSYFHLPKPCVYDSGIWALNHWAILP